MDFASRLPLELDLVREFHDDRSFGTYQVFFPLVQDRCSHSDKRYGLSARFSCHPPCRILEPCLGRCVVHRVASRAGHVLLPTRQFGAAAQVLPMLTCTSFRVCQERDMICRTFQRHSVVLQRRSVDISRAYRIAVWYSDILGQHIWAVQEEVLICNRTFQDAHLVGLSLKVPNKVPRGRDGSDAVGGGTCSATLPHHTQQVFCHCTCHSSKTPTVQFHPLLEKLFNCDLVESYTALVATLAANMSFNKILTTMFQVRVRFCCTKRFVVPREV